MKTNLTITIKKRSQSGWLVWTLILLIFSLGTLNEVAGIPYGIRYVLDIIWIALFVMLLLNQARLGKQRIFIGWILAFAFSALLIYMAQYQSAFYFLWGMRNNFRYYVAFFAFIAFLSPKDVEGYWQLFDKIFWIDIAVSLVQFFVFDYNQDSLGGIFGTITGVNGYTNLFFLIILSRSVLLYLEKKEKTWGCVSKCVAALIVSAMAELKFFFVEFVLVVVLALIFTSFTWRKLALILGGAVAIVAGASLLTIIFPNYEGWFSLGWMLEVTSADRGYTSSGDLNRLNAITKINEMWLKDWAEQLFGLGLGNCDTSAFDFLNTPFFKSHGDMHYSWISYAIMYLECGWIGLVFYFGFFVLVYFEARKVEKRNAGVITTYCRISRIMAIMCVAISIYNASLRGESGYMAYFVLAIPFALDRTNGKGMIV